jgi:hypothetical protein
MNFREVGTLLGTFAIIAGIFWCVLTAAEKMQAAQDKGIDKRDQCVIKAHEAGAKGYRVVDGICYLEAK